MQVAPPPNVEDEDPPMTPGKVIHKEITYRGIDWLLNSTVAVSMAYWSARTESGQKYFQKPIVNFFRRVLAPVLKTEAKIAEGSRWGSMFVSIMAGGTAIIPPITFLENKKNKKAIIRKIDEIIYGKEKVESDPDFKEAYDAIDHEPKKDFWTGMAARITVLAPMIGATVIPDVNKKLIEYLYNPVATGSKALCKYIGLQPKKMMEQGMMQIADGDISKGQKFVSNWDFLHQSIGFDLSLTFIYAYAHEFVYNTFAAFKHNHKNGKGNKPPVIAETQAYSPSTQAEEHQSLAPAGFKENEEKARPSSIVNAAIATKSIENNSLAV